MIGSGKTRLAADLADRLSARGRAVQAYAEFDPDHPIRSAETDRLRREQHGPAAEATDLPPDPLGQWDALAARCRAGTETVILDASLLQTALIPLFAADAPKPAIHAAFDDLLVRLAPAAPLLVYLRPTDIDAAVTRVHAERGADWAAWNMAAVSAFPWARRQGLAGRAAVTGFYRAWEPLVDALLARYPFPHLLLTDPQQDRAAALQRIAAALGR
jgi:hypothetical protein